MQCVKEAVILAAGLGSRLGLNMPKCLVEIGGKAIIDYNLELLEDIPNIYVVVGYEKDKVIKHVKKVRNDAIFIENSNFASTSNTYSLYLGLKYVKEPYLLLFGDVIFNKNDFKTFINNCNDETVVGLTLAKSEEAVFADVGKESLMIKNFQRRPPTGYEIAGIFYFKDIKITKNDGYVFEVLNKYLPLKYFLLKSYEIDTKKDLNFAVKNLNELEL
ncbi:bifunctional protein GlmU [Methanobrevibacter cuticularis]|uniref:Bifunctional protein GlmU n=1 Tax=Methanobrevibacter cuticularis TaxID=47311 RepID=A0A166DZT7_9EURY|nr:NTP transferase domain-containing protein [Methanobrevibacter cuticularis]KZX16126.1 bifunctional protein GlmU [Methanobrevibacter cuticularis]